MPRPLPRIDLIVDLTVGHCMLSFMDAHSWYNQIRMNPDDEEKTSFITDRGLYYYSAMPFGLKNMGVSYQWLVNCMFNDQIGRNIEVYADDLLVKSGDLTQHLDDLRQAFAVLRRFKVKLPGKVHVQCGFQEIPEIHGETENQSQRRESGSHPRHAFPT